MLVWSPRSPTKQCGNILGEDHGQESWGSGAQPDQITQVPVASNSWNGEMKKGKMAMIPGTLFASCAMFQLHLRVSSADLRTIYLNGVQCLNSGCNSLSFYRLLNNSTKTRQSQTIFFIQCTPTCWCDYEGEWSQEEIYQESIVKVVKVSVS